MPGQDCPDPIFGFRRLIIGILGLMAVSPAVLQAQYTPLDMPNEAAEGLLGVDHVMFSQPYLEGPAEVNRFPSRLRELWTTALSRPGIEDRRQAVDAIALAHRAGYENFSDLAPRLRAILNEPDLHPLLQRSVVNALVSLDDRDSAAQLLAAAGDFQSELVQSVDPALARWDYAPARAVWLRRLQDPAVPAPVRQSAMASLAQVREERAMEYLLQIVQNRREASAWRLAAAAAAGRIQRASLEVAAESLLTGDPVDRLCAARLLRYHGSQAAVQHLLQLAMDAEPTVAATALERLVELDPSLIQPDRAAQLLKNPDTNVRRLVAQALSAQRTAAAVRTLGATLQDSNPKLRRYGRESLLALAEDPELRPVVLEVALAARDGADWRGLEQAAFLLGALDHDESAPRLLELMRHERSEVRLAACVGLRRLAVPDTLPQLLRRAEELTEWLLQMGQTSAGPDSTEVQRRSLAIIAAGAEQAQLMQTFGVMNYRPAEKLMRVYIPKNLSFPSLARAAAIWSLGLFYENHLDENLAQQWEERLSDIAGMIPEDILVRRMSAIGLGRMKARQALPTLERFYREENSSAHTGGACRWAIIQITGQDLPPLEPVIRPVRGFFLEPAE